VRSEVVDLTLLVAVALITVGSRILALAILPPPRGAMAALAQRLPAPLFAALAALSLAGAEGGIATPGMLAAVCCALAAALRWRSLLVILGAGVGGFVVAGLIL
jgi:branched-subunit amino acid transport protein AzlD